MESEAFILICDQTLRCFIFLKFFWNFKHHTYEYYQNETILMVYLLRFVFVWS